MVSDPFTDVAMPFIWRPENDGNPFHDTPGDHGGATILGITLDTWTAWQKQHDGKTDLDSFKAAPRSTFIQIFRTNYWQAVRADELPPALAVVMFDAAVLSGAGRAVRFLQSAVGVTQDGVFGNVETMPAVKALAPAVVLARLYNVRRAFYAAGQAEFVNGWQRRNDDCLVVSIPLLDQ